MRLKNGDFVCRSCDIGMHNIGRENEMDKLSFTPKELLEFIESIVKSHGVSAHMGGDQRDPYPVTQVNKEKVKEMIIARLLGVAPIDQYFK